MGRARRGARVGRIARRIALLWMQISQAQFDEVIAHAQADAPNECCGYMRLGDGTVDEVVRAENLRASPSGYEIDPKALLAANDLDDDGFGVAIYHSHPRWAAVPSATDLRENHYGAVPRIIVSLLAEPPDVRVWRLEPDSYEELAWLAVEPSGTALQDPHRAE